jgi:hypothetical protein
MTTMLRNDGGFRYRWDSRLRPGLKFSLTGVICTAGLLWVIPLQAQSVEEDLKSMRLEIQQLRQEVNTLREELRRKTPSTPGTEGTAQQSAPLKFYL